MKVLAATLNKVSNTKMFSIMLDIPTAILAEFRTHRILDDLDNEPLYGYNAKIFNDFNMSANSARAIPISKYIDKVESNPNKWLWTGKQAGMTGSPVTNEQVEVFEKIQKEKLEFNISKTKELLDAGCHKQHANRGLVEFAHTTCILSGTEWSNLFSLRCPHYDFNDSKFPEQKIPIFYSKKSARKWLKEEGARFTELHKDKPPFTNKVYSLAAELDWYVNGYKVVDGVTVDCPESGWEDDPDMWNDVNKSSAQPEFQVIAEQIYDLYCEANWKESKYHIPFESDINHYIWEILAEVPDKYTPEDIFKIKMKISASMCAKLSYNTQENEDTLEKHLERADKLEESQHWEVFSHQAVAMDEEDMLMFYKSRVCKTLDNENADTVEYLASRTKKYYSIIDRGWAYNLKGFISQRYILENL